MYVSASYSECHVCLAFGHVGLASDSKRYAVKHYFKKQVTAERMWIDKYTSRGYY